MTKHLRFLFVVLLAMIWSAGWAAVGDTYTMVTNISQLSVGDVVVIGNAANKKVMGDQSGTKFRIALDGTYSDNVFTDTKGEFAEVTLEAADNGWYLKTNTGYLYANSSSNNTINSSTSSTAEGKNAIANITISNNGDATIIFTGSNTRNSIRYNGSNPRFSCYTSSSELPLVQIYKKGSVVSKEDPKIAFAAESYEAKITDKDDTYHSYVTLNNPNNLSVTYASSKTDVAEVNAAGEVKVLGLGTTTISATFAGDDTYQSATVSYELTVVDPNVKVVVFTAGVVKGTQKTSGKDNMTTEGVKIDGSSIALANDADYRFYVGSSFTISVETGTITKIEFLGKGDNKDGKQGLNHLEADGYTAANDKSGTWVGNAKNVKFSAPKIQARATSITVYVSLPSGITLDETEDNTIEANTGVNVTLKRSMVADEWNTICLPFTVTYDKAKAAFGNDVKIAELDTEAAVDANVLSFKASEVITAATPYLIKPSTVADEYTFENVDITNDAAGYSMTDNADVAFKGIYNTVDITSDVVAAKLGENYYAAFLGEGNKIYKANGSGNKTKGFRAYFAIPGSVNAPALRVVIDGTATSIKNIDSEVVESNAPVYNLQGQRVNGNNLTPGIYVKAGKKFVVK